MAANLNKVFIMGNLTRDPELRYIPSGTAVANFTVAVNRVYKDKTGEKKEEVSFLRVVVWGRMAEICGEYLVKGRPVLVEGRLQSRSWEAQDGQKRSVTEIIAENVQFLGKGPDRAGQGAPQGDEFAAKENVASVDLNADGVKNNAAPENNAGEEIPF